MGVYCTEIDHILQDLPRLLIKMKYKDTTCQNQNVTSANSRTNGGSERRISFMATFDTEGAMCNATPTDIFDKTNLRNNIKQRIKLS